MRELSMQRPLTSTGRRTPHAASGFTLIELMVTVVIVGILASVSVPSYLSYVRQGRRADAKTALLDLAGREERYFNTNNAYTVVPANLGYSTSSSTMTNVPVGTNNYYYQVTISVPGTGLTAPSYSIIATPLTADQQKDTACATFYVDSTGAQTAKNSGGTVNTSNCW